MVRVDVGGSPGLGVPARVDGITRWEKYSRGARARSLNRSYERPIAAIPVSQQGLKGAARCFDTTTGPSAAGGSDEKREFLLCTTAMPPDLSVLAVQHGRARATA